MDGVEFISAEEQVRGRNKPEILSDMQYFKRIHLVGELLTKSLSEKTADPPLLKFKGWTAEEHLPDGLSHQLFV